MTDPSGLCPERIAEEEGVCWECWACDFGWIDWDWAYGWDPYGSIDAGPEKPPQAPPAPSGGYGAGIDPFSGETVGGGLAGGMSAFGDATICTIECRVDAWWRRLVYISIIGTVGPTIYVYEKTREKIDSISEVRGHSDPISGLKPSNPGRDANGNCLPCPPKTDPWPSAGGGHGGWHWIEWNQNPQTCECYPKRMP
jgi:hypothetical protein